MADPQQPLLIPEAELLPRHQLPPSNGRPRGARNLRHQLMEAIAHQHSVQLAERLVAEALAGDPQMMKIIMDRIWPRPRTAPVAVDLPRTDTPDDVRRAMHELLQRTAAGELTTDDGAALLSMMRDIVAAHSIDAIADHKPVSGAAADPRAALLAKITRLIEHRRRPAAGSDSDDD